MFSKGSFLVVTIIVSLLLGGLLPLPGSSLTLSQETPNCTCPLQQQITNFTPAPTCYNSTIFTLQPVVNGHCTVSPCAPPATQCEYSLSITVNANSGQTCNFAISVSVFGTVVASCSNCARLTWSPATDPVLLSCGSQTTYATYACEVNDPSNPCNYQVAQNGVTCAMCNP